MALEELADMKGKLAEMVPNCKPGSWRESAEIIQEKRQFPLMQNTDYWTANFGVYCVEDREPILYFGGRIANPIFSNVAEAAAQILKRKYYVLSPREFSAVLESAKSGHTLRVRLSDLGLGRIDSEHSLFMVRPHKYMELNPVQRALAEAGFGKGEDFLGFMKEFEDWFNPEIPVCVLNPGYVSKIAVNCTAIALPCAMHGFDNDCSLIIDVKPTEVNDTYFYLRAIPKNPQ